MEPAGAAARTTAARQRPGQRHGQRHGRPDGGTDDSRTDDAGLLDGWLVDTADDVAAGPAALPGIEVRARPLIMTDVAAATEIAAAALQLAREIEARGAPDGGRPD